MRLLLLLLALVVFMPSYAQASGGGGGTENGGGEYDPPEFPDYGSEFNNQVVWWLSVIGYLLALIWGTLLWFVVRDASRCSSAWG